VSREVIHGAALELGSYAVPCAAATVVRSRRGGGVIRVCDVPSDVAGALQQAVGPDGTGFEVCVTDDAGRTYHGRIACQVLQRLRGDLLLVFEGEID